MGSLRSYFDGGRKDGCDRTHLAQGTTRLEHAEEYADVLERTGVRDYEETAGNRGVYVLRRLAEDKAHFLTMSLWESLDAIEGFAGSDIDQARYYPEDEAFLLTFEETVHHYEVTSYATPDRDSP